MDTDICKIYTINIAEHLFPILLQKVFEKEKGEHIEKECYFHILRWTKEIIKQHNYDFQPNVEEFASNIGILFTTTLDDIINDFFNIRSHYGTAMSSINASMCAHHFFDTYKKACEAHILSSRFEIIDFSDFKDKFNHRGFCVSAEDAYPIDNRPRGNNDINSVEYHRERLNNNEDIEPIWLINKGDSKPFTILDGHHRVVACSLEKKYSIPAYVIYT